MSRSQAELQTQRNKLANSYSQLLEEFSSTYLRTVGNYTLGKLIGKGSFGKVYLAQHKLTNGSKVVLKSAKKDDSNLAREIHHHRQFLHPHIARLYEVIVTEKLVWLVLEYCPGDELYNYLLEHGKLEVSKAQRVFTQLVGAVCYVHGKQCVHRDLKLENILLDKNENVKLVDFGFTREYNGTTSYLQTWCGTVCYSAPEMLKGEKYAGEKVDVWSLGIILYALLCGELPFDEDDESATKSRILKDEPNWPDYMPQQAKELIQKLLSKRPLLRPPLADILRDPFLADYAPQQQEILKLQQPAPFSTELEKSSLQRMRSAGVDIDMVIEHVLAQRCDTLAGWWALLIEKEERKQRRRERKRREKEAEAKSIRRLSAASSRLLAAPSLKEINEETVLIGDVPRTRGRNMARTNGSAIIGIDLPIVNEGKSPTPESSRPPPIEKDSVRSRSSGSRSRPPPPPKEYPRRPRHNSRRSSSMLRMVTTNPDLLSPSYVPQNQRKKKIYQQPIREQLASLRNWFKESAKRAKSPTNSSNSKNSTSISPKLTPQHGNAKARNDLMRTSTGPLQQHRKASFGTRPDLQTRQTFPARPRISTTSSAGSAGSVRPSRSPNTLTPHSSYRKSSAGLRGRKSTSSSVSSIRSMTRTASHRHSHSKASSTSSASMASPSGVSVASGRLAGRSPHSSIKVLPGTPTTSAFPSGIRVARKGPPSALGSLPGFTEARGVFGGFGAPSSPSLPVFAKRKRSIFKGPMAGSPSGLGRAPGGGNSGSRNGSVQGRRSGEQQIIEEEEEEEEVEEFSPIDGHDGVFDAEYERDPMADALEPASPALLEPFESAREHLPPDEARGNKSLDE